jgi:hypothetical protein
MPDVMPQASTSLFQCETTPGGTAGLHMSSLIATPLGCSLCYTAAVAPETVERTHREFLDAPAGWIPLIPHDDNPSSPTPPLSRPKRAPWNPCPRWQTPRPRCYMRRTPTHLERFFPQLTSFPVPPHPIAARYTDGTCRLCT